MIEYFAGLDVSVEETAICVVGDDAKVVVECAVETDPTAIAEALRAYLDRLRRAGHEAGSLSPWLHGELLAQGVPAICLESPRIIMSCCIRWRSGLMGVVEVVAMASSSR
ncbi:hypothetical protein [Novosphingobium aquae]|uniref:hypothetical protein n=1 Tax=Novosphingobium aquae TaxID=3133435 RepID=UPI003A94215D